MPNVDDVARDFTALLRSGQYEAASRYWAKDVVSIEPADLKCGVPAVVSGVEAAKLKSRAWSGASRVDDLSIDGPFVTGNQFALFLDMIIVNRVDGQSEPFAEIALYTVRDGEIAEERYFYQHD